MVAEQETNGHVDLVCEGGGVKGIGLVGAYAVLEERGYKPQNIAGTSAGAITAALIAADYSAAELKEAVLQLDFRQFADAGWKHHLPLARRGISILVDGGIYKGDKFLAWMRSMLAAKGIYTFADLQNADPNSKFRSRLQVIASDISSRDLLVLPRDAGKLGLEPDELEVASAVRMSISIPLFFQAVRVKNKTTNHDHVIVDGSMLSNFPVWLFDCEEEPKWPTFGLLLVEPDPKVPITGRLPEPEHAPRGARAVTVLLSSIVHTMLEAHDRLYVEKAQFARTVPIPTLGVGTTEFDLSRERALELHDAGRAAAQSFLETWNFDAYIREFRSGKVHRRRDDISADLTAAAVAVGGERSAAPAAASLPGEPIERPTRPLGETG